MYTIAEFRKNTRKAFNDAAEGHEVVISRHGELFQLVALVSTPIGGSSFESTPTAIKPIIKVPPKLANGQQVKTIPYRKKPNGGPWVRVGVCKVHGVPLDARGKCLQKGCKNA